MWFGRNQIKHQRNFHFRKHIESVCYNQLKNISLEKLQKETSRKTNKILNFKSEIFLFAKKKKWKTSEGKKFFLSGIVTEIRKK